MHYFFSAGEPSGDLHGQNLIRSLRKIQPGARFSGFGGDRMAEAGCNLLFPLCNLSVMFFLRVLLNIRTFFRLKREAGEFFERERPDAVILIDYPGFNWHVAAKAKEAGIPVFYFVPPQLWAWAGWRVKKMRRNVDCVLSALPFEHEWFKERGVGSVFIGHPFYDELRLKQLDSEFLNEQAAKPGRLIALLPGSRRQEVARNFPDMLDAAEIVSRAHPEVRFTVASYNAAQAEIARLALAGRNLPVEIRVGKTSEIVEAAECVLMVSGSVCLEVMYRLKPAAVIYRMGRVFKFLAGFFIRVKYVTLVNLIVDDMLLPEFPTAHNASAEIAAQLNSWLDEPATAAEVSERLRKLRSEIAQPGACDRAAGCIADWLAERKGQPAHNAAA